MDIRFLNLDALYWVWAVLIASGLLAWAMGRRNILLRRFASSRLIGRLSQSSCNGRRRWRSALIASALALLCLSMLDPRWGTRFREIEQSGIDTFFVLDVSQSMLADDARPNRLERAKTAITDVLDIMGSDRAGLITVAGNAAITVPLTLDYGSMRLSLDEVTTRSVGRGGSMIGDGIRVAARSFSDELPDHKAIIVLTDGEDMGSFPEEAAADAADAGIRVFTVGLGDENRGARIPIRDAYGTRYLQHQGQDVWTKMHPDALERIARAGGGAFVPAGTANLDLASIYAHDIATMAGRSMDSVRLEQFVPRFQWFLIPALVLLIIDSGMSLHRRSRARPLELGVSA